MTFKAKAKAKAKAKDSKFVLEDTSRPRAKAKDNSTAFTIPYHTVPSHTTNWYSYQLSKTVRFLAHPLYRRRFVVATCDRRLPIKSTESRAW